MLEKNTNDQFEALKNQMKTFLLKREWEDFHTPKNISMSIAIEAAELMEIFQWNNLTNEEVLRDETLVRNVKDELADILIYCISMAMNLDIDLYQCVLDKFSRNEQRFPIKKDK